MKMYALKVFTVCCFYLGEIKQWLANLSQRGYATRLQKFERPIEICQQRTRFCVHVA